MMIRLASAAAIAALMSTAAMAQSSSTPMTQPAPKAPMAQSAPSQMGPSARLMMAVPANGTTVTNYYNQSVFDPSGTKIGDVGDRDALVLTGKASFAEEVVRAKNCNDCLLTLLRHDVTHQLFR